MTSDAENAIRAIEQHLYDILRAGPGVLWQFNTEGKNPDALFFAVECLAQFQDEMHALMVAHGIQPRLGPELEPLPDESGNENLC